MSESRHQILSLAQIEIQVTDLQQSLEFYIDKLGLTCHYQTEEVALLNIEAVNLLVVEVEAETVTPSEHLIICLQVKDIFATYQRLLDLHLEFTQAPHCVSRFSDMSVWQAFTNDPDGHVIGLQSQL